VIRSYYRTFFGTTSQKDGLLWAVFHFVPAIRLLISLRHDACARHGSAHLGL